MTDRPLGAVWSAARAALALLLASALAVSCGGAGEGSATTTTPTDPAVATRALLAGIAADAPGCPVAVGRGHRIVFAEARGLASLTPPRPNTRATVMDIGSTSKPFIALAILLLADEGRLSLDDDDRRDVDAACLDSESRRRSRYG